MGTLKLYVNGYKFMEIENFEEIIPRELNTEKEKQIGVPFNLSFGGGSQGLHDHLIFSSTTTPYGPYRQDPELFPNNILSATTYSGLSTNILVEQNFGGTFMGGISQFRMYTEPLGSPSIQHNFRILEQQYRLFNFWCPNCLTPTTPTPTPTATSTPTPTPTVSPTPTPTTTVTPTPTATSIISYGSTFWDAYGIGSNQPTISMNTINNSSEASSLLCGMWENTGGTFSGNSGSYYSPNPPVVGTFVSTIPGGLNPPTNPFPAGNYLFGVDPSEPNTQINWIVIGGGGIVTQSVYLPFICPTPTPTPTSTPTATPIPPTATPTPTPTGAPSSTFTMRLFELGEDVILSGTGSFDTTNLTSSFTGSLLGSVRPNNSNFFCGEGNVTPLSSSAYGGPTLTVPSNFGSGVLTQANTGNGVAVGIQTFGPNNYVILPTGYVSNSTLTTQSTFTSKTLSLLGATVGTYTYSWGSGSNVGILTLIVGS
jgi:hypothetical protein